MVDEVSDPGVARDQAGLVAHRGRAVLRRPAAPSGDAGADAARRGLRHRGAPAAGGDRRLPDGPGPDPLPRLPRPAALLPPGGRRGRRRSRRASSARPMPQTTAYAHKLGLALQLTNIIRDVGEDALRGRIYLPVNELQQFDVKAHEILNRLHSERFVALMKFQAERAHAAVRRGAGAAARGRPARAEAGPDDGQHLPHAAARDRARRLPGAAPAREPDAAAQAVAGLAACRRWASCD